MFFLFFICPDYLWVENVQNGARQETRKAKNVAGNGNIVTLHNKCFENYMK